MRAQNALKTLTILGAVGNVGDIDLYTQCSRVAGATWQPAYLSGCHPWGFVEVLDWGSIRGLNYRIDLSMYSVSHPSVAPANATPVAIDIKPESESNHVGFTKKGFVRDAVFSTKTFDARTINSRVRIRLTCLSSWWEPPSMRVSFFAVFGA